MSRRVFFFMLTFLEFLPPCHSQTRSWQERAVHKITRASSLCSTVFDVAAHSQSLKEFFQANPRETYLPQMQAETKLILLQHLSLALTQLRSTPSRRAFALSQPLLERLGITPMSSVEHVRFALQWLPQIISTFSASEWEDQRVFQTTHQAIYDLVTVSGLNQNLNHLYPDLEDVWPETIDAIGEILATPALIDHPDSIATAAIAKDMVDLLPVASQMAMGNFHSIPVCERLYELRLAALRLMPALAKMIHISTAITENEERLAQDAVRRLVDYTLRGHNTSPEFEPFAIQAASEMGFSIPTTPSFAWWNVDP